MTVRRILTWPNKRLLKQASMVEKFDNELISLCKDMSDTMRASFGVGLAATQIGVEKSVCIVLQEVVKSLESDTELPGYVALINPSFSPITKERFKWEEQCLSIPNFKESVERNSAIRLKYQKLSGEHVTKELTGFEAGTIQHEVDHLSGKLFIHRLKGARRSMALRKLQKIQKKKAELLKETDEETKIGRPKRRRVKNKKGFGKLKKRKK